MNDEELKQEMIDRFMAMDNTDQKLFLLLCIDAYFDCVELGKKAKNDADLRVAKVQEQTYLMIINLFNEPADVLKETGFDNRQIMHTYIKDKYKEVFETGDEA